MKIQQKFNYSNVKKSVTEKVKKVSETISQPLKNAPQKVKTGALAALFLLPTLGIVVNKCSGPKDPNAIVIVDEPIDKSAQEEFLEKGERSFYIIQSGDTPQKIANKNGISTRRLLAENGLTKSDLIFPSDTLLIPESYQVKNVKNISDAAKATGLSEDFLNDLKDFEKAHETTYIDRNGNKTIGIGHLIKPSEAKKFEGKKLSESEIYNLLAQDITDKDLDMKTLLNEKAYNEMPSHLKESVIDLIFNKGVGALEENKPLLNALNKQDYETAVASLNQDYSLVTNAKGEKVKKPASGLNKRRLYDIQNASKIFKNGIPDKVFASAKKVYNDGLTHMEAENNRGEFKNGSYENIKAEYKALAFEWFNGKLGAQEKIAGKTVSKIKETVSETQETSSRKNGINKTDKSQQIYLDGKKTNWTVQSLYEDWEKTAKKNKRPFKRPMPEVDKNGKVKALVKIFAPTQKGVLSGKTIIVNPGHGGAMGNNGNLNFDPGTSNSTMSSKNKNVETNIFKGNSGKPLEEWIVNQRIAEDLTKKITSAGGKVVFVQGSVYSAMDAIRKTQNENKVNLVVSLHSNSDGDKRGIYLIANKKNGKIDNEDKRFAQAIENKMNEHSWFKGITKQTEQSLGVLSSSKEKSSPIPGVLIETGNLKNESDVANLNSKDFKNHMINAIFLGIEDYLK